MLSAEKNRLLTQVGPGTPMGELLRRYWMPIGGASELDTNPIKPIRLMGEDLVLYKDLGGTFGLLDRHCPHRRADLSYGFVEQTGIRCNYHGWLMDEAGRCIEQPYDDTVNPRSRAKERCSAKAYPVKECAGLLLDLYGAAARARTAGVGAVHLGERLSRSRPLRRPLQLVSVPGELVRSSALRMDARQLEPSAQAARPALTPAST